jgi:NADH-quinone oxidoreductase subunit L
MLNPLIYLLILGVPFCGLVVSAILAIFRVISNRSLIILNILNIFFTLSTAICIFLDWFKKKTVLYFNIGSWFNVGVTDVNWGFMFDGVTIIMILVVSLVSFLVHLYSLEYMAGDPNHLKFMQYLTLFTLSMFILITANNLVQLFIGWEGVGVCSFLLINFWDSRIAANTSALKAIIVNRVGDFGLIFALILLSRQFGGTFEYGLIFSQLSLDLYDNILIDWIVFFLFLGAVGKSAQVFLHVWLPDAMEGPTPVSALIHAATMVTAGVFLIIRCCYLFELSPFILKIVLIFGGVTALFAGSVGMVQVDLKKVIAYSTCSQLGFMVVACGLSAYDVALFHLAMHAFFKALLFLSAGSIIHAFYYDEQDIRRMGGALSILPVTYISFFIGSIALMGFPYTAGYYSKDFILELLLVVNCPISKFSMLCCFLAVICTTFYSTRLLYFVFFSQNRNTQYVMSKTHESSFYILIPLLVLSFFSLCGGFLFKETFVSSGVLMGNFKNAFSLGEFFYSNSYTLFYLDIEELYLSKLISFFIVIFVTSFTLIGYNNPLIINRIMKSSFFLFLFRFLQKKWYFDILYAYFSRYILNFSYNNLLLLWDRGFLESFGPLGGTRILYNITYFVRSFQNGDLKYYLESFGLIFFLLFLDILYYFGN